ncbi:MAG: ABC transporter substrate-binding protein [Fretibacterium sp.]|nr:ABC transporter substrate-binding protein [Fretibacterium sp.]
MNKKTFLLALSLFLLCFGFTGSVSNAAELEGTLTLYTSQPEPDAQALIEAFNRKHPKVTVNLFRSGTEEVISKVMAERQANALQADVMLVADAVTFEGLKAEGLLLSYASPELEGIPSDYYDAENTYTGTKIMSTGIIYNTDRVKTAPKSFADLTKPEVKDELTMPSPLYSGAAAYNLSIMTRTEGLGWDFYRALKENGVAVGKGNGGVKTAVTAGDKAYGIIVDYMAIRAKQEGAPVEFVYPEEGSLSITEPIGILKETKNPELAKAFVDFILSKDGQEATAAIGYTPIKAGVAAPEGFRSAEEIQNLSYPIEVLVENREADKKAFADMFN